MREQKSESAERDAAKRKAFMLIRLQIESDFDKFDIQLFEERLPPLLKALSGLSAKTAENLRRPGQTPIAWLRIDNVRGGAHRPTRGLADRLKAAPAILDDIRGGSAA